jgi:hypothetical protein
VSPLVYQSDETAEGYYDDEGIFDVLGGVLNPIGAIGSAIGGLLGPSPPKPPMATIMPVPPPPGVSTGTINTPAGNATIKLPESVVSTETFRRYQDETTNALNMATSRLRATEGELKTLRERVATVVTQTQQEVEKVRREDRAAVGRLRRKVSNDSMMSMMMGLMASRRQQDTFEGHTHDVTVGTTDAETDPPRSTGDSSDNMMMMLPMMMMGQGEGREGEEDGGGMMAMVMAMAFMR